MQLEGEVVRVPLRDRSVANVVDVVASAVASALPPDARLDRVGVGVPGFVRQGVVVASPNFPEWTDVDLKSALASRLNVPVTVENDANAATLGAAVTLGVRGDLVLLTLGTGVGGGVISEGKLLRGRAGTAAELGHTYVGGDRECNCGGVGCLEQWCSTTGLLRSARERGQSPKDGEAVVEAARQGDAWAVESVREAGERLGIALTNVVNIFAPEVVALAGGLSQAEDLLAEPAMAWVNANAIAANRARLRVHWLGRADQLAIVGSGAAALGGP